MKNNSFLEFIKENSDKDIKAVENFLLAEDFVIEKKLTHYLSFVSSIIIILGIAFSFFLYLISETAISDIEENMVFYGLLLNVISFVFFSQLKGTFLKNILIAGSLLGHWFTIGGALGYEGEGALGALALSIILSYLSFLTIKNKMQNFVSFLCCFWSLVFYLMFLKLYYVLDIVCVLSFLFSMLFYYKKYLSVKFRALFCSIITIPAMIFVYKGLDLGATSILWLHENNIYISRIFVGIFLFFEMFNKADKTKTLVNYLTIICFCFFAPANIFMSLFFCFLCFVMKDRIGLFLSAFSCFVLFFLFGVTNIYFLFLGFALCFYWLFLRSRRTFLEK